MDVTDRKKTEAALRENEARLRELLSTIDLAAVFVRDVDGRIRFWSQGCERLYGWTAEEAVGRTADALLQTVFPASRSEIQAMLLERGEWQGDVRQQRRDRSRLTISVRKVLRRDADGHPRAVLESAADVTSLRQAEVELRALNQELETRVHQEVEAREAAQARAAHAERMQALGQLAGGIAHDFNNVLQGIQGGAALIAKRAHDESAVQRLCGMILDSAGRGASITRRLLAFSRRADLRAEPIDASVLLESMREVITPALGPGVALRVEAAGDLPLMLADKGQLETTLVNLATNARDAMPHGGTLVLSAVPDTVPVGSPKPHPAGLAPGRYIRLRVADTGQGMDRATLARVLEPFFTTKPAGQGTGLGLSMTKGFAEQSGGALAIESHPGLGTVVSLWLPQAEEEGSAVTARADARIRRMEGAIRVLLVDDEPMVREVIAEQLEDVGYDVLVAAGGEEAWELLVADENVDVLVTDLSMPGMDGLSLIRKAQALRPRLRAILLTGHAGDAASLAVGGAVSGGVSLLRKPVSGEQLADSVASLLEESE
jgi:PAS domain S-box-containing protein